MILKKNINKILLILIIISLLLVTFLSKFSIFIYKGPPGKIKIIKKKHLKFNHFIVNCDKFINKRDVVNKLNLFTMIIKINNKMKKEGLLDNYNPKDVKIFINSILKDIKN